MRSATRRAVCWVSFAWLAVAVALTAVIWCNSLVSGEGSGSLSLTVMRWGQEVLAALGLPSAWLTNFIVRKAAHFTEYALLGIVTMRAWRPHLPQGAAKPPRAGAWLSQAACVAATALALVLTPSVDETIQLFIPGRSGQLSDVLLDCAGAATGAVLVLAASAARRLRARGEDFMAERS